MSRSLLLTLALVLNALVLFALPVRAEGKRVALVIGNASYSDVGALANPIIDADAVSKAFESAGFDDVRHVSDLSADIMRRELKDFSARAAEFEIAVIYYAGHGVEVNDQNYLVPIDAKLLRSTDIDFEAIPLSTIRSAVAGASKLRIIVLDACRNNPFRLASNNGKRAATRGLGNIEPSAGEVIAYSAKEGTLAQDGPTNTNSPFAAALIKNLNQPGLEIRLLFGKVRDDVLAATANEQEPYTYASLGGDEIYLNTLYVPNIATSSAASEWKSVSVSQDVAVLQAFESKHQDNAVYRSLAQERLAFLQSTQTPKPKSFRDCKDCPEMVTIPAGQFVMGSPDDEPDHEKDEGPQHDVTIGRSFAMGKFEVTRAQYEEFVSATGHDVGTRCSLWDGSRYIATANRNVLNPGFQQTADDPATCLSWHDANAYIAWLSKRTGLNYRLLTEAEWEYAARAGSTAPFATGQILDAENVNFNSKGSQPVGQFAANAYGLYDMQGNVWEWTQDCYAADYSNANADGSAYVTPDCERTYRGGAWANTSKDMRFATRGTNDPDKRVNIFGLRVARDLR